MASAAIYSSVSTKDNGQYTDPGAREIRARMAKANALARLLLACNYTTAHLAMMAPDDWAVVAKCANVRPPSEQTIDIVFTLVGEGKAVCCEGGVL